MPRLGLLNMIIGFGVLFFAAAAGAFIATDTTRGFVHDQAILQSWQLLLQRSAHGHTNLFGMIHILFGLTLQYSRLSHKIKICQTWGLGLGTLSMSVGMLVRSYIAPSMDIGVWEVLVGGCLSAALASLGLHCFGLFRNLNKA